MMENFSFTVNTARFFRSFGPERSVGKIRFSLVKTRGELEPWLHESMTWTPMPMILWSPVHDNFKHTPVGNWMLQLLSSCYLRWIRGPLKISGKFPLRMQFETKERNISPSNRSMHSSHVHEAVFSESASGVSSATEWYVQAGMGRVY